MISIKYFFINNVVDSLADTYNTSYKQGTVVDPSTCTLMFFCNHHIIHFSTTYKKCII